MGGGHCLICYSFIPNSNTFNSSKNPQNCVSLCKLLQLPVEPFRDIFNGSPTCPECTKGLQEGAQVIKRFEKLQKELNQLRITFENKLRNGHKLSLDENKEDIDTGDLAARHHEERALIIKELGLYRDEADTPEEFQANYSPFAQNMDSPESPDLADPEPDDQEEFHMSRTEISSLPEIKLFENEGLATPGSQNMILENLPSLSDPMDMPGVSHSGQKKPRSSRNKLEPQSNCITLKVPLLQLVKLPLPRGQTTFTLKDLASLGVNPFQKPPKSPSNLPEPIFKHKFVCTLCFKVCVSPDSFYTHSNYFNHTLKTFQCCSNKFPTVARLNQHRKLVHGKVVTPKRLHQCDECGLRCKNPGVLQAHINAVHLQLRPYACTWPECTESFKTKARLKYHVNGFHKNYRPFLCEQCPKSFVTFGRLNLHLKRVHDKDLFRSKGVFKCDACPSIFPYEEALVRHVKSVHNPVRHLCTICGYELKTKLYLSDHMKLHEKKGDKFRPRNRSCWKRNQQEVGTSKIE